MAENKVLFPFDDLEDISFVEKNESRFKRVKGKNAKEMLKTVKAAYKAVSTVTLDEYCDIVYEWLLLNKNCFSVLEFYEDESNRPFEYPMEDVEQNERICHLLEQRIVNLCLTEKQFRYTNFGSMLMCNKFKWLTSRPATDKQDTPPPANNTDVTFKFGS
jgi:hypothetical protein